MQLKTKEKRRPLKALVFVAGLVLASTTAASAQTGQQIDAKIAKDVALCVD